MAGEVTITGLVEVQRTIKNFPRDIVASGFPKALKAAGAVVQDAIRPRTPKRQGAAHNREFPPLEASLVTDIRTSDKGGVASTGFGDAGHVALWNEYGHRIVTHARVDTGEVTTPRPFMRPATAACADEAIDVFCESIVETVREDYGH